MGEIADVLRRATGQPFKRERGPERPPAPSPPPSSEPPAARPVPEAAPEPAAEAAPAPTRPVEAPAEPKVHALMATDDDTWQPARIWVTDPRGRAAQQYRRLAIRMRELANARGARSVAIMSAQSGDGKIIT